MEKEQFKRIQRSFNYTPASIFTNQWSNIAFGVGMIGVSALFSIITLPVEYNASQRALAWLQSSHTLEGAQLGQAKEALSWAARTYLVAALSAVASLLYYVLMILGRRD